MRPATGKRSHTAANGIVKKSKKRPETTDKLEKSSSSSLTTVHDEPTHQYNTRASKKKRLENLVVENPENKQLQTTPSSGRKKSSDKVNKKDQTKSPSQSQWETQETSAAEDERRSSLDDPDSDWKDRMKSLHRRRDVGLWIQCCRQDCRKWRFVGEIHDPVDVPEIWYCNMNPDKSIARCDYPAEKVPCEDVEDAIENKYNAGSIVWARLDGYPWWPAMVDDNPYTLSYYKLRKGTIVPNQYNVTWFDEGPVKCSWIPERTLRSYKSNPPNEFLKKKRMLYKGIAYKDRVLRCCIPADEALQLSTYERLEKFSFIARYGDETDYPISRSNIEHNRTQPFRGRATIPMKSSIKSINKGTQEPSTSGVGSESGAKGERGTKRTSEVASDVVPLQEKNVSRVETPSPLSFGESDPIESMNPFPCQSQVLSSVEAKRRQHDQPPGQLSRSNPNATMNYIPPIETTNKRTQNTSTSGVAIKSMNKGTQEPSTSGVAIKSINKGTQEPTTSGVGSESGAKGERGTKRTSEVASDVVPLQEKKVSRVETPSPVSFGESDPIQSTNHFPCQSQVLSSVEAKRRQHDQPPGQLSRPNPNATMNYFPRSRQVLSFDDDERPQLSFVEAKRPRHQATGQFSPRREVPSSVVRRNPPPVQPPQIHVPHRNLTTLEIARGRATSRMESSIETTNKRTQNPSTSGVGIESINRFRCQRQDLSSDESESLHYPHRNWAPLEIENRYDFPDFDPELKKMSLLEHIEFLFNGQIKKIA